MVEFSQPNTHKAFHVGHLRSAILGDVLARIAHAEKWLAQHPRDAQLLFALGRLCRRKQLWGKAQSYLEASLSIRPMRHTHLELASLFDELGRTEEANRHYRQAASL